MKYLRAFRSSKTYRRLLLFISGIGAVYLLLFTIAGNRLLSPAIEKALSSAFSTPVAVREFSLTHNRFRLMFQDDIGNTISTQGGFSLITVRMYAHYRVEYFKEGGINAVKIPLYAEGSLSGGIAAFDVQGSAHALGGDALYRIQLRRFKLATLYAELNRISYEGLLHLFEYPSSTDTRLSGTIDLKGFDRRIIEGLIHLDAKTGRFAPTEILPDDGKSFDLRSLLADRYGRVKAFSTDVKLEASMDHAGILEQFAATHMAGPATINATLSGNRERLRLRATSTLARSDTTLVLTLSELEPEKIELQVKHADIPQLFTLFALPSPLKGQADADGVFTLHRGELNLSVSDAATVPNVLKQEYNLTQPPIRFDAKLSADLGKAGVRYRGSFVSDLKRLDFNGSAPHDEMLRELLKTFR